MSVYWSGLRAAAFAFALVAGDAGTASADDFMKECKIGMMDPANGDKVCSCMDGKIKGADRDAAIGALKKTNEATQKGNAAELTPQDMKGAEAAMTAQTQCM